ncbi:hypothetical protein MHYP_G00146200 [Metynnis hypsauchen]
MYSGSQSAPSEPFVVSQCSPSPDGFLTLGCLTSGFLPAESLRFSWTDGSGGAVSDAVQYPAVQTRDGKFTAVSHVRVQQEQWKAKTVTCRVEHPAGNRNKDITVGANSPPTIRLLECGQSIMCIIEDFYPEALSIKWKKNDREVRGQDWKATENDSGSYRALSILEDSFAPSRSGTRYTCEVTHGGHAYRENLLSRANSPPNIRLEGFGQSIMCVIEDFYPKPLSIRWKKNNREVRDWKSIENDSGSYTAVSVLDENLASSSPGTKYTCEVTHGGKTYTKDLSPRGEFSLKINPPQAKDLFINQRAVLECVLTGDIQKAVEGATVSWTIGGRNPATRDVRVGGVTQAGSAFTKTSTLILEESVWFSGAEVICSTSVDQRTTSDKISVKRGGQRPSIIIYKPDKTVSDSDSVSLVCEVSSSDHADVYVMWRENGGQYLEANSMTTIIKKDNTLIVLSYLTVTGQQYNSAEITCAVKDANIQNDFQPRTSSPSKTNSPPTIRLVEFGQTIMCIIEDFYPKSLRIKWKKDDREVQGRDWKTTENDSGSYRAVSVLEAKLASSSPGTKYTCEATHRGRTYSENLSSKVQSSLKINPPQSKDLFLNRKAVIECVLSGDSRKEVEGATVSWTVGGRNPATRDVDVGGVTQAGSAFIKTSTLTLEESIWFSGAEVICSTSVDQRTISDKISVKRGGQRPSIIIYKPDKTVSDSDSVSLVCEVSSSDHADVYVMWRENGGQYLEANSMTTIIKKDNTLIVLSYLTVTGQQYNSAEITCAVKDANIQNDFQPRTSSPSKTNSPPTIRLVEFGQTIMCIIEDFYPKSLRIKWKKDDREVQGRDWKTTENDSGSYRAVSVLEAKLASSSPGTKYTCEATHRGRTYSENLSSKVQSSLKINPPQSKDLFLNRKAVIECVLSGDSRKEVEGATVSWTVGGRNPATRDVDVGGVTQAGSAFIKTSTLTLEESIWFSGAEVICSTSVDQRTISDKISVKRGGQRPSIIIYKPDKSVSDSDSVSLACEVSSSDHANVYVMWQVNGANSPPTIRLVEFGQSVMCIIEDFYPKSLRIKWKKDDREVQGRDWKTTENDSGSYRAVSVLEANLASSSPGTKYTCEVTHRGRTYSENLSSKVQSSLKINPPQAKGLFINKKAVIECVLSGDSRKEVEGATVSWTVGGRSPATRDVRVGGVTQAGSAFTKTSTLTLEESTWFSGAEVICYTSVDQRTISDKISVKRGGQRPSIIIYKPDKTVSDSDSVSLVCEVSSSDHADVYVMWRENGGQYLEANSMTTIIKKDNTLIVLSYLTVTGQQYNSAELTCAVKDANIQNDFQPRTSSPSKTNSPPKIRLVEFGQSIMCIIEDFYPKPLSIKWKKNDREVRGRDWKTTENDSGSYRKVSVLDDNMTSLSPGTKYICEVTHGGKTYTKDLSPRAQFSLKIHPPQAKELFINKKAVMECVITGDNKKQVKEAKVSWVVPSLRKESLNVHDGSVKQAGSSFTKTSTLTLEESMWFSGTEVMCSTSRDQIPTSDKISVKRGGQRPSIMIYKPDKSVSDSDSVSLVCEVSTSDLANAYIMWQVNNDQYREGNSTTTIIKKDNTVIVLSYLTVTGKQYNSEKFACAVKDANMKINNTPTIHTTSMSDLPWPDPGWYVQCDKDPLEEDEFNSLWSTASSFIFLFLFSLLYSTVLCLYKTK